MEKTFQGAQLTHERFLTIDHSCKIFFWYLPNWTSTDLWCVVLYITYSTTHQRSVEVQFGRYQKNILQEWSMVKNLSCVSCAAWNVFPINSLLRAYCLNIYCDLHSLSGQAMLQLSSCMSAFQQRYNFFSHGQNECLLDHSLDSSKNTNIFWLLPSTPPLVIWY